MLPAHTIPTRYNTCLDHNIIKTNFLTHSYVLNSTITDHNATALFIQIQNSKPLESTSSKKIIDYNALNSYMKNLDLSQIYEISDVNSATKVLVDLLSEAIKTNTKLVKTSNRKRTIKPWMTPGLLRCMKNRDNLFKKLKKHPDNETLQITYKRYRNFCNGIIKKLKNKYDEMELLDAKKNSKLLWDTIKRITHTKKVNESANKLIQSNDSKTSINEVNTFFTNVGKSLA